VRPFGANMPCTTRLHQSRAGVSLALLGRRMRQVIVYEPPSLASLHPLTAVKRLQQFWQLISVLTIHRLKVRYARTHLGYLWALLQPLSFMLVFTMMFSLLGRSPAGEVPYPLFAYAALVPWTGFAGGVATATSSLTSHATLLTKVAFPREILPLTYVVAALVDMAVASIALLALAVWYQVEVGVAILWIVPALFILTTFLCGVSLLLAAIHVRFRDIGIAVPILLQVWMFLTPVIYPLEVARKALSPSLYFFYTINPMVAVVDTFRQATIMNARPDVSALVTAAASSAVLLPIAYVYFKYSEKTMADVV
jgi:lipopolysaccharide transport system permease protein